MILLTMYKGRWCLMLLDDGPVDESELLEFDDQLSALDAKAAWEALLDD